MFIYFLVNKSLEVEEAFKEPPRIRPKIPFLGHIMGILKHKMLYYVRLQYVPGNIFNKMMKTNCFTAEFIHCRYTVYLLRGSMFTWSIRPTWLSQSNAIGKICNLHLLRQDSLLAFVA